MSTSSGDSHDLESPGLREISAVRFHLDQEQFGTGKPK